MQHVRRAQEREPFHSQSTHNLRSCIPASNPLIPPARFSASYPTAQTDSRNHRSPLHTQPFVPTFGAHKRHPPATHKKRAQPASRPIIPSLRTLLPQTSQLPIRNEITRQEDPPRVCVFCFAFFGTPRSSSEPSAFYTRAPAPLPPRFVRAKKTAGPPFFVALQPCVHGTPLNNTRSHTRAQFARLFCCGGCAPPPQQKLFVPSLHSIVNVSTPHPSVYPNHTVTTLGFRGCPRRRGVEHEGSFCIEGRGGRGGGNTKAAAAARTLPK